MSGAADTIKLRFINRVKALFLFDAISEEVWERFNEEDRNDSFDDAYQKVCRLVGIMHVEVTVGFLESYVLNLLEFGRAKIAKDLEVDYRDYTYEHLVELWREQHDDDE